MKKILIASVLLLTTALTACMPGGQFTFQASYASAAGHFERVEIIASGPMPATGTPLTRADISLTFLSSAGTTRILNVTARYGELFLADAVAGTEYTDGDILDAETLRQTLIALGVASAGRFKIGDAEALLGLVLGAARGPGAVTETDEKYPLIHVQTSGQNP